MSLDLFRVQLGLDLLNEDYTSSAHVLHGDGTPSGSRANDAPIGSIWMNTIADSDELNLWWKHTAGTGLDKWSQGVSTDYVSNLVQGISWREPARVLDDTVYADSSAFPTTGIIDGVTLTDGDRVLFTNVTAGTDNNIWLWDAVGSSWSEDPNQETSGDSLFVLEGTYGEQQWTYNGTDWFQFGGTTANEVTNLRLFVGKDTTGNNYPNYVSEDVVSDGNDLRLGISQLDDAVGQLQFSNNYVISDFTPGTIQLPGSGASTSSTTDITAALDALDATYGSGLVTNITASYALTDEMSWHVNGTLTLTDAFNALNNAIGSRELTNNFIVSDSQSITDSLDQIDTILGDIDNSSEYTSGGFLSASSIAGNNVQETFDSFNIEIGDLSTNNYSNNGSATVSTTTVLEPIGAQLLASEVTEVTWQVQIKDSSNRRQAFHVHALTDGTTVDYTRYAVLKTGGNIGGSIGFNVAINSGRIEPTLTPAAGAGNLTFTIKRLGYSYLA